MINENSLLNERYQLTKKIGQGGFAQVFRATDLVLERQVAVKVLNADLSETDINFAERFKREAKAVAALDHPNILAIYDYGQTDDTLFLVMPLVEGGSLYDKLKGEKTLDLKTIGNLLEQIAAALDYAHRRNIVHRDIKPHNMLLRAEDNRLLLADFGIAKVLSSAGNQTKTEAIGTLSYMAPEQISGNVSKVTDVYALGCVLFQMLTGQAPYTGETAQVLMGHLNLAIPSVISRSSTQIPNSLQKVIDRALAKHPDDRYQSAGQLYEAYKIAVNTYNDASIAATQTLPLAAIDAPTQFIPPAIVQPQVRPAYQPPAVPTYPTPMVQPTVSPTYPPQKSNAPLIAGIIGAVLLLLAGVGGGVFLLSSPRSATPTVLAAANPTATATSAASPTAIVSTVTAVPPTTASVSTVTTAVIVNTKAPPPTTAIVRIATVAPVATRLPNTVLPPTIGQTANTPIAALPTIVQLANTIGPSLGGEAKRAAVEELLEALPGKVGAVVTFGDIVANREIDLQMPAASTIKLWIAATVLERVGKGELNLSESYTLKESDRTTGTGLLNNRIGETLDFEEVLGAMLAYSDNTAANILIDKLGGFQPVNDYATRNGYSQTRLQRRLGDTGNPANNLTSARDATYFIESLAKDEIAGSGAISKILEDRLGYDADQNFFGKQLPKGTYYVHISGTGTKIRNEIGFIDITDNNFVSIVILSSEVDEATAEKAILDTVAKIYTLVK